MKNYYEAVVVESKEMKEKDASRKAMKIVDKFIFWISYTALFCLMIVVNTNIADLMYLNTGILDAIYDSALVTGLEIALSLSSGFYLTKWILKVVHTAILKEITK